MRMIKPLMKAMCLFALMPSLSLVRFSKYSPSKGEFIDVRRRDLIPFDENLCESKQILYTSKDGTKVPMNINYKKGIKLDGKNPTVLYGYGGFGATENLAFHKSKAAWLEHGGVWATAFIRGGSEYGHTWHKDGRLLNKMNVFDDFAAAADYLAQSGYALIAIIWQSLARQMVGCWWVLLWSCILKNSVSPYQRQACA